MPQTTVTCPQCGKSASMSFGQSIVGDKLMWFESVHCASCGLAQEADGEGSAPDEIRILLIAAEGEWTLEIAEITVPVMRIFREEMAYSLGQMRAIRERGSPVVLRGTQTEMRKLQRAFDAVQVQSHLKRVE